MFDLSNPLTVVPEISLFDSNIIIAHFLSNLHQPQPRTAARARRLIGQLLATDGLALIATSSWNEILHFAIKSKYRLELSSQTGALVAAFPGRQRFDWVDLYKIDPGILVRFAPDLEALRQLLTSSGFAFLEPRVLLSLDDGLSRDIALIHAIGRYGLDSNDASLLLEAKATGVDSIATFDPDFQRAAVDFDIYTWL